VTLRIHAPLATKRLTEAAVSTLGKSVSEFTIESVRSAAIDVLVQQRMFAFNQAGSAGSYVRLTIRQLLVPGSRR
jgi:uncharacterized protein (DUF1778 family)